MFDYEDITNSPRKKALVTAEDFLQNGWSRRGYPAFALSPGSIPWKLACESERSWNFYIHCWDMLDSLLKAYCVSSDAKFLQPAIDIALEWSALHLGEDYSDSPSSFAWYDMEVGLHEKGVVLRVD